MGDRKIYIRDKEVLAEIKYTLLSLNTAAIHAMLNAAQKLADAAAYLRQRQSYWEKEYDYWAARLYDREGRIDPYASSRMAAAKEKISIAKSRLDTAQMHSQSVSRYSGIAKERLEVKASSGGAFLDLKREQAAKMMSRRVPQARLGQRYASFSGASMAGVGSTGSGKLGAIGGAIVGTVAGILGMKTNAELREFANTVQKEITEKYGNNITSENTQRKAGDIIEQAPFWKFADSHTVGLYDGQSIMIRADKDTQHRSVHEIFHMMSDNGVSREYHYRGIAIYWDDKNAKRGYQSAYENLNEGITEMYARRYSDWNEISSKQAYYNSNVYYAQKLEAALGKNTMERAYFKSDTAAIQDIFAKSFGDSRAFARFSKLVDLGQNPDVDEFVRTDARLKVNKMLTVLLSKQSGVDL